MQYESELYHYGIKGMKWGVRRYQNPDGSLTPAGRKRELKRQERRELKKLDDKYPARSQVRGSKLAVATYAGTALATAAAGSALTYGLAKMGRTSEAAKVYTTSRRLFNDMVGKAYIGAGYAYVMHALFGGETYQKYKDERRAIKEKYRNM